MKELDLQFIKKRREELKISMQEMAEELGMKNAANYWKYENGTYTLDAKQLPPLAKALKCEISDFFRRNVAVSAT